MVLLLALSLMDAHRRLTLIYPLYNMNSIVGGRGKAILPHRVRKKIPFEILSGVFEGKTTGTPISMLVRNKNARPADYEH